MDAFRDAAKEQFFMLPCNCVGRIGLILQEVMRAQIQRIAFDCERMKYPHTGLYHFCMQLGNALLQTAPDQREVLLYAPASARKEFPPGTNFLTQHSGHKLFFPSTSGISLWHSAHQDTDYFPSGKKMAKVLTIHDLNYLHDTSRSAEKKKKFIGRLQKRINETDYVVAISQFSLNDLKQHVDIGGKPATVIYNGCNILEDTDPQPPALLPSKPFLFTLGTITAKKNFHTLPTLLEGNDLQLLIGGITQDESYKEKIIATATGFNVKDRVIFTGPLTENDKRWYLKHCAAFLFPSLAEGFGLPVIEAMYYGRPVILSTAGSLPEIGGKEAFYFEDFDPAHMKETLLRCLHDFGSDPMREERIRKHAGRFSWTNAAIDYHKVYGSLLQVF
jgi:glycosyltransferase involved in cell wall biosynthesis